MKVVSSIQSPEQEPKMAGFGLRLVAYFIDILILIAVSTIIILLVMNIFVRVMPDPDQISDAAKAGIVLLYYVGAPVLIILYYALFEASKHQGTLGKIAVNIIVTDQKGRRLSFARAMGRNSSKIISSLIFCLGYLMIAITDKKQGLHDMMANTYVVKNIQPSHL